MVKNFINNSYYFGWDDATHGSYFKKVPDAVMVEIPKLVEMATVQIEVASVPFASFIANKNQSGDPASYSFVLRGYVRHWLDKVWATSASDISLSRFVMASAERRRSKWAAPIFLHTMTDEDGIV